MVVVLPSPWYQMTPRMCIGCRGAIMPLKSAAGVLPSKLRLRLRSGGASPWLRMMASSAFSRSQRFNSSPRFAAIMLNSSKAGASAALVVSPGRLIHDSAGVPPQVESTRPTGIFSTE